MPAGSVSVDVNGNFVPFERGWTQVAGRLFSSLVVPPPNMDRFVAGVQGGARQANSALAGITAAPARTQLQALERAQQNAMRSSAALATAVRGVSTATQQGAAVQAAYKAMLDAQLVALGASTQAAEADALVRRARQAALAGETGSTEALNAAVARQAEAQRVATAAASQATAAEAAFSTAVDDAAASSVAGAGAVRTLAAAHRDAAAAAGVDAAARQQELAALAAAQQRAARSQALLVGGGAAVFGGVKVLGELNEAVQATAQLNDTAAFSEQVFGSAFPKVEQFAKGAADAIGQSRQQALDAATTYASLGRQAGLAGDELANFSIDLVKLASDMRAARGGTVEDALLALTSGLSGTNTEPLRRYGILLSELSVKEEARRQGLIEDTTGVIPQNIRVIATQSLIMKQAQTIIGQYAREYDELPARQERVRASLENLKVEIGEGALPAFEALVGGAERVIGVFTDLPDAVQAGIGTAGAALGVLAIGGGTLALIAGAYNAIGDAADRLRPRIEAIGPAGERAFGRLATAGRVAAGVIAAAAISEAIFAVGNEIQNLDQKATDAMNRFAATAGKSSAAVAASFHDLVQVEDDALKLSHVWTTFGERFRLAGAESVESAADMHAAFQKVFARSPEEAQRMIDALREQNDAVDHNSDDYKKSEKILDEWQASVDAAMDAQEAQTGATERGTSALNVHANAVDDTVGAYERLANAARESLDPVLDLMGSRLDVADAKANIDEAQRDLQDILTYNTSGIRSAREALVEARKALAEAQADTGPFSEAADRAREAAERAEDRLLKIRREQAEALYRKQERERKIAAGITEGLGPAEFDIDFSERIARAQRELDRANADVADVVAGRSDRVRNAQERVADAQRRLNEEMAKAGPNSREAAEAERDYERALINGASAVLDHNDAQAKFRDLLAENPGLIAQNEEAIRKLAEALGLSADQVERLIAGLHTVAAEAGPAPGSQGLNSPGVNPAIPGGVNPTPLGPPDANGRRQPPPGVSWTDATNGTGVIGYTEDGRPIIKLSARRPGTRIPTGAVYERPWTAAEQAAIRQRNDEYTALAKAGKEDLARTLIRMSLEEWANWKRLMGQPVPGFARGGIVDEEMLALIGERGREFVIPADPSVPSARPLWEQAGRELGVLDANRLTAPAVAAADTPPSTLAARTLTRGGDGASIDGAGAAVIAELRALRDEVARLREVRAGNTYNVQATPEAQAIVRALDQRDREARWKVQAGI